MKLLMLKFEDYQGVYFYVRGENESQEVYEKPLFLPNTAVWSEKELATKLNETFTAITQRGLMSESAIADYINDTQHTYVTDGLTNTKDYFSILIGTIKRRLSRIFEEDYRSLRLNYNLTLYEGLFLNPDFNFEYTDFDDFNEDVIDELESLCIIEMCDNCNTYHFCYDMVHTEEGHAYCSDCDDCYIECDRCGDYHDNDSDCVYTVLNGGNEETWCRSCADYNATWIDDVDGYVYDDDVVEIHDSVDDIESYFRSEENYARDNYYYDEDNETWWTSDCWDSWNDRAYYYENEEDDEDDEEDEDEDEDEDEGDVLYVHEYSHTFGHNLRLFGSDDYYDKFIGFELEIARKNRDVNENNFLEAITPIAEDRLVLKRDSSINNCYGYGIEIVSMPHTFEEFWKNKDRWFFIMKTASQQHYVSHEANKTDTSCGLHFHISRTLFGNYDDERRRNIAKVIYFIDRNFGEITKFSRRKECDLNDWAGKYNVYSYDEALDTFDSYNRGEHCDRYKAVNITNSATVEFRMCRGTLKPSTFFASADFIMTICKNSLNIDENNLNNNSLWLNGIKPETLAYIKSKEAFMNTNVQTGGEE